MGWRVIIGEDADADKVTLDQEINIDVNPVKNVTNGIVDSIDFNITIRGKLVGDEATLKTLLPARTDLVAVETRVRRIRIQAGGTDVYDFQPGLVAFGPFITDFDTVTEDGQGSSIWRFTLSAFTRLRGGIDGSDDSNQVSELDLAHKVVKNRKGEIIQKVWRVNVVSGINHKIAESFARTFKPQGDVSEEVETFSKERRAVAIWTWNIQRDRNILEVIEEAPIFELMGNDFIEQRQLSSDGKPVAPVLHEAAGVAGIVRIGGFVRSFEKEPKRPALHLKDSDTVKYSGRRSRKFDPIPDPEGLEDSLFIRRFEEVYIVSQDFGKGDNPKIPKLNHGDHADIVFLKPPAAGPIDRAR